MCSVVTFLLKHCSKFPRHENINFRQVHGKDPKGAEHIYVFIEPTFSSLGNFGTLLSTLGSSIEQFSTSIHSY